MGQEAEFQAVLGEGCGNGVDRVRQMDGEMKLGRGECETY